MNALMLIFAATMAAGVVFSYLPENGMIGVITAYVSLAMMLLLIYWKIK